ncbi:unnamed protein product [Peronospora belbahrii]|uniref:Uncharacterized protein n=1 Tax=Peronospora belbahrii TaxID=622444 RepID=A0AAU9KYB1_9STRA|nr:unnamed protein product [Peronospora belbahrii]CAH0519343.1 unnamed protein product [Peronospora belbahrii]
MTERRKLNVRELLELERQIYQESIDRVLEQQEKLNKGILDEFIRRCKPFETDKERELQVAQYQYEFSQQDALSLFEFDVQQAHDVYRSDRQQLQHKLLERIRRQRRRIEKRLQMVDQQVLDTSNLKKKTRQRDHGIQVEKLEPKLLEQQLRQAQQKTRTSFNFRHLSKGILPTPERIVESVVEECTKLQRNREREEAWKMEEEERVEQRRKVVVNADTQELLYHGSFEENGEMMDETFRVGDAVMLVSRLTEEDFHGFVSAITMDEVKLVLVCGTHVRVTIARLRCGQCTLRKQTKASELSIEKREDEFLVEDATNLEELLRDPPDARRHAAAIMSQLKRKTTTDARRGF